MISVNLMFTEINKGLTALLCLFSKYILVMCAEVESKAEFEKFTHLYSQYFSWAEKNIRVPYQDEYYQIQLLNNKPINSQRSLTRTNKKLSRALIEMQNANSTISQLERDEQTNLYRASAFYVQVQKMFKKAPDVPLDIMVLSITHFTLANDVYGWKYIENLLKAFSEYLIGIENAENGVGTSSLSMAADMPVDVLKLDRSFLTNDLNDTRHAAIIQFIINLAKVLHMKIIAEGVETQEQAELLKSFDCHYAQGYLYSKPIPVDLFLETYR